MARSDLILALVQAGSERDDVLFRRTVDAMVAEERAKKHNTFADQIALRAAKSNSRPLELRSLGPRTEDLAVELIPKRTLSSVYLDDIVAKQVDEFLQEHLRIELLRSYGLEPRQRVLLTGAPGNGKTSLAEAISEALSLPIYTVRYDGIIGSLLGETARRMNTLVERVSRERCVIFFDEFDAIAKTRSDEHETGEMKRLVTALLSQLDRLAPHVIVIAATNHPELLDRAIWRRFNLHLRLNPPDASRFHYWLADFSKHFDQPLGIDLKEIEAALRGTSYSDLEELANTVRRRYVLGLPDLSLERVVREALQQLKRNSETKREFGTTSPYSSETSGPTPN